MIVTTVTCDQCGATRGAANHWLLQIGGASLFSLYEWRDDLAQLDDSRHLCGAGCAVAALSAALERKKPDGPDGMEVVNG